MKLPKELREKSALTGKTSKGKQCSVKECSEPAVRSLSDNKWGPYVEKAKLEVEENKRNKIYLCKAHYKQANKIRKSEEIYYKKGFLENKPALKKGRKYD